MKVLMVNKIGIVLIIIFFIFATSRFVFSQNSSESNTVCTKIGTSGKNCEGVINPTPPIGKDVVSCPLKGKRVLSCASFMSDSQYNRYLCQGAEPIDRGHCGKTYTFGVPLPDGGRSNDGTPGCWIGGINNVEENLRVTKFKRWANAIDIDAPAGELVYAPLINNQSVQWKYYSSRAIPEDAGGGLEHGFVSTVGSDKWMIYTEHMGNLVSPPSGRSYYESGDPLTRVGNVYPNYVHLHFNVGKNPVDNSFGPGWLPPESLGTCITN